MTAKTCVRICFNKVASLRPATLLKKRLLHRCFSGNFEKVLIPILQNICEQLFLSLKHILNFRKIFSLFHGFGKSCQGDYGNLTANGTGKYRSSFSLMFYRIGVLKNFVKFTEKYLRWSLLFKQGFQSRFSPEAATIGVLWKRCS